MSMGAYAWGPLAPFITGEYGVSRARFGLLSSALYLTSVIVAIPSGFLVDKLGARMMLIFSLLMMGLPFCFIPAAKTFFFVVVLAALGGIGYGIINQVSTKGIMLWFPRRTRATAMGIKQTGVTLGGALSAIFLPVIAFSNSWESSMLIVGVSMILMAFAAIVFYREKPERVGDTVGMGAEVRGKGSLTKIISNPILVILMVIMPFMCFSQSSMATFLVLYLNEKIHLSIGLAGSCLTIAMIAGALGRIAWGLISDTFFKGDRIRPSICLSLAGAVSIGCMGFINKDAWLGTIFILSALMGFTVIGWNALVMTLGAEIVGQELAGSYMGISIAIAWAGIVSGPPVFGYLADVFSYRTAWSVLSLAFLFGSAGFALMYFLQRGKASIIKEADQI
jgi:sugar phosphate permease